MKSSVKLRRRQISVTGEQYAAIQTYSEVFGLPLEQIIAEALTEFTDCVLSVRLEAVAPTIN